LALLNSLYGKVQFFSLHNFNPLDAVLIFRDVSQSIIFQERIIL